MSTNNLGSLAIDNNVKVNIEKIELPSYVTRNMFDCYEQQLFTLCQLYRGEFWKLFVNQSFKFVNEGDGQLEKNYKARGNVTSSAANEYGIHLEELHNHDEIVFKTHQELYLAEIDHKCYEFTQDLEGEGTHCLIIYGEDGDKYLVNDNYYRKQSLLINKKELNEGMVRYYRVIVGDENKDKESAELKAFFSNNILYEYKKVYEALTNNENDNSNELIDFLTEIYKYCNKVALVIRNVKDDEKKEYIETCAKVVEAQVKHLQNSVYAVIKKVIREVAFDYNLTKEILLEHKKEVAIVQNVLDEMRKIVSGEASLADGLLEQLKKYESNYDGELVINKNDSVYDFHDKLTVLFLLNFLEEGNAGIDVNYEDITDCDTYLDFLIVTYTKLLEEVSIQSIQRKI